MPTTKLQECIQAYEQRKGTAAHAAAALLVGTIRHIERGLIGEHRRREIEVSSHRLKISASHPIIIEWGDHMWPSSYKGEIKLVCQLDPQTLEITLVDRAGDVLAIPAGSDPTATGEALLPIVFDDIALALGHGEPRILSLHSTTKSRQ